jgi:hypothetical protein
LCKKGEKEKIGEWEKHENALFYIKEKYLLFKRGKFVFGE